ncbi:MAG: ABC transporter ATP-binding protein [Candidatus Hinthialibacter antarcticus]|nr:ABC transporter ATP-binding protein [Candidatus Hinthialibacter antarcticus]
MDLVCEGLRKTYPDGKQALKGIDLHLDEGLFGLLGPNGAGKTTFMEILTLLLEPTEGRYIVDGIDSRRDPMKVRAKLGYLPQFFGVFPELTAKEFLEYLGALRGMAHRDIKREVDSLLALVRLQGVRNKRLKTYSGGMLRRVGVAQALLGDPKLVIVDEPTAGLDPEERVHLRNLLFEFCEGRIVILSTHIVKDIEETCSQMALLQDGRIRYQGSPSAFVTEAQGQTWEFIGDAGDIEALTGRPELVSIRELEQGLCFRVVSQGAPRENARLAPPNLEDAYVRFLNFETTAA